MKNFLLFFVLLALLSDTTSAQQSLIRGPYLHVGTPSSMVVRWRTDSTVSIVDSKIWYGTQLDTSTMATMTDTALKTNHEFNITGLSTATIYYYAVGTSTVLLAPLDSTQYFKTSPAVGATGEVRIWAIGDYGTGNTNQANVRDAYLSFNNNKHMDVLLTMGDNAYDDGRDNEFQTKVFDMYPQIFKNTVIWPSPGNHDYGSTHPVSPLGPGPYFDNFTMPANGEAGGLTSETESYYSFDYGNVHFISINTEEYAFGFTLPLTVTIDHLPAMLTWLEDDLAANTNKDWIIAYLHATPYSKGTHTESYSGTDLIKIIDGSVMRSVRDNIVPVLENYGVDVILGGHSHVYERSYLIYGNYGSGAIYPPDSMIVNAGSGIASQGAEYKKYTTGPNPNRGTVYAVVGCSGKIGNLGSHNQLDHELYFKAAYELGSMVIEVNDNRLDAFFIDTTGSVFDEFTIIKDPGTGNSAPIAVDDVVSTDTSSLVVINVQFNDNDPNGDPLITTILSGPSNGTAQVIGTSIEYTPNTGFSGTDTIIYVICDNGSPPLCDTAMVIITVMPGANNAPVAVDDVASTDTSTLVLIDVQFNDYDANGDPLITTILSGPGNGTAQVSGTSIEYTPNTGFSGTDTIIYIICDNGSPPLCDTAMVIITVVPGFVGMNDLLTEYQFSIHPNPFTNSFEVEYVLNSPGHVSLIIYNIAGQKIGSIVNQDQKSGRYHYTVDETQMGMTKGTYIIQLNTRNSLLVQRIIRL